MPFNTQEEIIIHLCDHLCAKLLKLCAKLLTEYTIEFKVSALSVANSAAALRRENYQKKIVAVTQLRDCLNAAQLTSFTRLRNFLTKLKALSRNKLFTQNSDKEWGIFFTHVNKLIRYDLVDYGHELLLKLSKKYRNNMQSVIQENSKMMELCSAYPECVKAGQAANQTIMDKVEYLQTLASLLRKDPADLTEQLSEYRNKIRSRETKQILRVSHSKMAEQVRKNSLGVVVAIEKIVALPV